MDACTNFSGQKIDKMGAKMRGLIGREGSVRHPFLDVGAQLIVRGFLKKGEERRAALWTVKS